MCYRLSDFVDGDGQIFHFFLPVEGLEIKLHKALIMRMFYRNFNFELTEQVFLQLFRQGSVFFHIVHLTKEHQFKWSKWLRVQYPQESRCSTLIRNL